MKDLDILNVKNLSVSLLIHEQWASILDEVTFSIKKGQTLALVGESGCGKSVTVNTLLRLLPVPGSKITSGNVLYKNKDILNLPITELNKIRGKEISIIFQDALHALNPVMTIRKQIEEVFSIHCNSMHNKDYEEATIDILKAVDFNDPVRIMNAYPHELSGGMQQRVMIAMALAANPEIIIADEPTTSLDITAQLHIVKLLKKIQEKYKTSIIFVTHDINIVKSIANRIVIMYAGQVLEYGDAQEILNNPLHPYTRAMIEMHHLSNVPSRSSLPILSSYVPQNVFTETVKQCRFYTRCNYAQNRCNIEKPDLYHINKNHFVRCLFTGSK